MKLRNYQQAAVDALFDYFHRARGNPLIALPTGTGKSVVHGAFTYEAMRQYPSTRMLSLTHVKELISQNFSKLLTMWPTAPAGIYSAGLGRRELGQPILFGGIQSIYNRADEIGHVDLVSIDEAHLVSPKAETMYRRLLDRLLQINPHMKVWGLSATCYRMGLGDLTHGGMFTDVAFDMTGFEAFNWLVAQGFLAPLRAVHTNYRIDTSGVPLVGGEYVQRALQEELDQEDVTRKAVAEMLDHAGDRNKWLIFASGTDHADHVADLLNACGVDTVSIHSKVRDGEREERYRAFELGQVRCAVNMNTLTTGIDVPDIDYIGILRPTRSTGLWVQMLGRGTRPAPDAGKEDCLVGDFTSNSAELGPINDPVLPQPRKKGKKSAAPRSAPQRVCPECRTWVHASKGTCDTCGHYFEPVVRINGMAAGIEVMRESQAEPVVELVDVHHVTYGIHRRRNGADALAVNYFCRPTEGNIPRRFKEYICLQHTGAAKGYADRWWRERCPSIAPPDTVQRAVDLSNHLRIPTRLRVWINKPRPEIVSYEYE